VLAAAVRPRQNELRYLFDVLCFLVYHCSHMSSFVVQTVALRFIVYKLYFIVYFVFNVMYTLLIILLSISKLSLLGISFLRIL
jgi:hypothetical protein